MKIPMATSYNKPVKVADGIFWIGVHDPGANLHCNSYIIIENERALVIDGGSRPEFAETMMKILQLGIKPKSIVGLIYQHYDPDLCGSLSNFIDLCDNPEMRIYSKASNNLFLRYYFEKHHHEKLVDLESINFELKLSDNRKLRFFKTPYTHSAGSFVTLDENTGTLFTSDLFGSFAKEWELFIELSDKCFDCKDYSSCPKNKEYCPLPDIIDFHKHVMPCSKALSYAMQLIEEIPVKTVAPQHGSVIFKQRDISFIVSLLKNLKDVGIDGIVSDH